MSARRRAFTLFEMTVALLILAVVGLVALGSLRSAEPERLAMVAGEVANALRYARAEALRHGAPRAAWVDPASNTVAVLDVTVNGGGTPVAGAPLDHPLEPGPYMFLIHELPNAQEAELRNTQAPFAFESLVTRRTTVLFDSEGTPVWWQAGSFHPLSDGVVTVGIGDHEQDVELLPTGRVVLP